MSSASPITSSNRRNTSIALILVIFSIGSINTLIYLFPTAVKSEPKTTSNKSSSFFKIDYKDFIYNGRSNRANNSEQRGGVGFSDDRNIQINARINISHETEIKNIDSVESKFEFHDKSIDINEERELNLNNVTHQLPENDNEKINDESKHSHLVTTEEAPFPVYQEEESAEIPSEDADEPAYNQLECRESVSDFVINASDNKDECEGLRRAFDTACTGAAAAQNMFSAPEKLKKKQRQKAVREAANSEGVALGSTVPEGLKIGSGNRILRTDLIIKNFSLLEWMFSWSKNEKGVEDIIGPEYNSDGKFVINNKNVESQRYLEQHDSKHKASLTIPTTALYTHSTDPILRDAALLQGEITEIDPLKRNHGPVAHMNLMIDSPQMNEARECCASILHVFHEHCDHTEEEQYTDRGLFIVVSVIAVCCVVKSAIRYYKVRWLPEAAGNILVGVIGSSILGVIPNTNFSFDGELFLRVMLPPIIFDASLSIDKKAFRRLFIPIVVYACIGTLLSTVIIACIIHNGSKMMGSFCETIPVVESLAFGCLISSIDPIAILSVLSSMGMSNTDSIYVLVFGESLFNDGVAVVLFQTVVRFLDDSFVLSKETVMDAISHFIVVSLGSITIGVLTAVMSAMYFISMKGCQTPMIEVVAFFCWALIPYYIADGLDWSGIVSIAAAGIVMDLLVVGQFKANNVSATIESGNDVHVIEDVSISNNARSLGRQNFLFNTHGQLSTTAKTHVNFVSEIFATLMETAIFAYLGLFLLSSRYHWNFYLTILAVFSCLASRAIMIPGLSAIINFLASRKYGRKVRKVVRWLIPSHEDISNGHLDLNQSPPDKKLDSRTQIVLWIAGLRGAMSFALVENIPLYDSSTGFGSKLKPELKAMTSASIIFTVFICGGTTFYILKYIGMTIDTDPKTLEMTVPLTSNQQESPSSNMSDGVIDISRSSFEGEVQVVRQRTSAI